MTTHPTDESKTLDLDTESRRTAIVSFGLEHRFDDAQLDRICEWVAAECGCATALVSVVDTDEQRFIGRTGTDLTRTDRNTSFCATAMAVRDITIVPDAAEDPRFRDYALVVGEPRLRFYAGAPLITPEGVPLGALCVLDNRPHPKGLNDRQLGLLRLMASAVMDRLLLRRSQLEGEAAAHSAARALNESDLRFRVLADAMPHMVWSSRATGYSDFFNAAWCRFTGEPEALSHGDGWTRFLHPDDIAHTGEIWSDSVATGSEYEVEYRLRRQDGDYRWILARGLPMRDQNGEIVRWFGTCTDVHEQKLALEQRDIISQELSHRIKNIFAVISGLIGLTARDRPEFLDVSETLRDRILALGRAHDFVRPHSRESKPVDHPQDSLRGLLEQIFAPYRTGSASRVKVDGADVHIDDRSATPLALLFHEMATNAAKYGALSVPNGYVTVKIRRVNDDLITMTWQEHDGPPVESAGARGFGSQLLDLSIKRQLGGDYAQQWDREGLVTVITIPARAFSRRTAA